MSEELALLRLEEESIPENSDAYQLIVGKQTLAECWAALDRVYNKPEIVKNTIQKEAHSLKQVKQLTDESGLRGLANFVHAARDDLRSVNLENAS